MITTHSGLRNSLKHFADKEHDYANALKKIARVASPYSEINMKLAKAHEEAALVFERLLAKIPEEPNDE